MSQREQREETAKRTYEQLDNVVYGLTYSAVRDDALTDLRKVLNGLLFQAAERQEGKPPAVLFELLGVAEGARRWLRDNPDY